MHSARRRRAAAAVPIRALRMRPMLPSRTTTLGQRAAAAWCRPTSDQTISSAATPAAATSAALGAEHPFMLEGCRVEVESLHLQEKQQSGLACPAVVE